MKHEQHGIRICYTVKEVKWDEENGWKKCKAPQGQSAPAEETAQEVPDSPKKKKAK